MPIYEYWCESCQKVFAKLQRMGAGETETVCPDCGGSRVTKQISACAVGRSGAAGGQPVSAPSCSPGGG